MVVPLFATAVLTSLWLLLAPVVGSWLLELAYEGRLPVLSGLLSGRGAIALDAYREDLTATARTLGWRLCAAGVVVSLARSVLSWRSIGAVALFLLSAEAVATLVRGSPRLLPPETLAHLALLLGLVGIPVLRRAWGAALPVHRRALTALGILMYAGQFAGDIHATYPFAPWRMYGGHPSMDRSVYLVFEGITLDGEREPVDPFALLPADDLYVGLPERVERWRSSSVPQRVDELVRTAGEIYRSHRDPDLVALVLLRCEAELRPHREPRCNQVTRVDLR